MLSGMHCVSCSLLIEGELEDIGVSAKVNYANQTADVAFDDAHISFAKIKETIEKLGYHVVEAATP